MIKNTQDPASRQNMPEAQAFQSQLEETLNFLLFDNLKAIA